MSMVDRWYEVAEMYRRILFIGILPLLGTGALRASLGCLLSIVAAFCAREASPFLRSDRKSLKPGMEWYGYV